MARFEREMEAVGRLDHPHIVRALDAREVDGIRFLVMEHVDGLDLAEVVARCGPLSVADACEVIRQAALGLQCSEEHGLVHRDIKPSNLMLTAEGHIKVLDLGLAQFQEVAALESRRDRHRPGDGHARLHVAGAGPGEPYGRHPHRHLLAGLHAVLSVGWATAVQRVAVRHADEEGDRPPTRCGAVDRRRCVRIFPNRSSRCWSGCWPKTRTQRVARPSEVVSALAPLCAGSKLIGLLRAAQAEGQQAAEEPSHEEASAGAGIELAPRPQPDEPAAAAAAFDPYHRWLGIPPEEQPADHYRLLGIPRFESDPEVIRDAATRQMAHVRTYHLGPHAELSQKILNELGMAKACLLDPQKKAAYDAALSRQRQTAEVSETRSAAPPAPGEEPTPLVTDPDWSDEISPAPVRLRRGASSSRLRATGRWVQQLMPWLRTPVGLTAVAGFVTVFVLGVVVRVQTNYGTVKIEIPAGIANLEVTVGRGDDLH